MPVLKISAKAPAGEAQGPELVPSPTGSADSSTCSAGSSGVWASSASGERSPPARRTPSFPDLFEVGATLGSGSMCVVRAAQCRATGRRVAAKCVTSQDEELRQMARDEYSLVCMLRHPNVIRFEALYESGNNLWICMELCHDGSVEGFVRREGTFKESGTRQLSCQLLQGVHYLHYRRVVHRDVKPANLLLVENAAVLKVVDFNSAKRVGRGMGASAMLTDRGTHLYSAPEMRLGRLWNERVDIWGCGLCTYFMLQAALPFDISTGECVQHFEQGMLPPVEWAGISSLMQNLIQQCLAVKVSDRPPAMELLLHPVFARGGGAAKKRARSQDSGCSLGRIREMQGRDTFELLPACGLVRKNFEKSHVITHRAVPSLSRSSSLPSGASEATRRLQGFVSWAPSPRSTERLGYSLPTPTLTPAAENDPLERPFAASPWPVVYSLLQCLAERNYRRTTRERLGLVQLEAGPGA